MSNAVLTNPSSFSPPLDISCSPHLLLHLWLPSLFLSTHHPSICPPVHSFLSSLQSHPLSLFAYFLHAPTPPLHHSFIQPLTPSSAATPLYFCPPSAPSSLSTALSNIHPQCFAVSHPLWQHHMCSAGQCVCVCVWSGGCLWIFQLMLHTQI